MNVYTYFEQFTSIPRPGIELLMKYWRNSWLRHGWTPVVLSDCHFLAHPGSAAFDVACCKLPTVNNWKYELACYRRWMAMERLGGGVLTDYDCINYGWRPEELVLSDDRIHLPSNTAAPCVVAGTQAAYRKACDIFMNHVPGEFDSFRGTPHTSDMHISNAQRGKGFFEVSLPECCEYKTEGWEKAKLVHYATDFMQGTSKTNAIERHALVEH
jgi:hypothetical protein